MKYAFITKEPDRAYIDSNLVIPKLHTNPDRVKSALTISYGEEQKVDEETGELIGVTHRSLKLWEETKHHLIVPREFIPKSHYQEFRFDFVDLRPKDADFASVRINDHISLRDDEQREAFEALLKHRGGTLTLSCGRGKTVLALKLAATLKIPTIVIVNTTALLEQWKEEIQKHLLLSDIGTIQGTICDWKNRPIVMAMIHTLANKRDQWTPEFRRYFGLSVFDESQHISAPTFVRGADLFYGRRYSLTATPTRLDGLERIYQYHLGRVIYTNLRQDLIPTTFFHRLKWQFDSRDKACICDTCGDINLSKIRTYLGTLKWRNGLIARDAIKDMNEGRKILILCHTVNHVDYLRVKFEELGIMSAGSIMGATPQEDRMKILRSTNPTIGTFQLAREGLNRPELDTLYIATPFSSPNDLQQSWGRIQRVHEGKRDPIVRVYEDTSLNCCVSSCRGLRRFLTLWSYPFKKKDITLEET